MFIKCSPYEDEIKSAVRNYWPDLSDHKWWAAQIFQESKCDPNAKSGAGAKGLSQTLDGTFRDLIRLQGLQGAISPFDAKWSIQLGAVYQYKQRKVWGPEGRTIVDRNDLGLCGYNRGAGNCLADQRECGGARLWADISKCTAAHTIETVTYVRRIHEWHEQMK